MRLKFSLFILIGCSVSCFCYSSSDKIAFQNTLDGTILKDVSYGEHERNRFDLYLPAPNLGKPTPLVVYFHGGGFLHGDKSEGWGRQDDIKAFAASGIAFATVNYRYRESNDEKGVKACLEDAVRFIQYIRYHCEEYNIQKQSIAVYGSSAGAGTSLYLAFSDDHANPEAQGLLAQSSRVKCVGALSTQATYDLYRWMDYIPLMKVVYFLKKGMLEPQISRFYGYDNLAVFENSKGRVQSDLDMLEMIDPEDPPTYVMNMQKQWLPKNDDCIQHHRAHARVLEKILTKNQIHNRVFTYSKQAPKERDLELRVYDFLISKLMDHI